MRHANVRIRSLEGASRVRRDPSPKCSEVAVSGPEPEKSGSLAGRLVDDGLPGRRRIITRMFHRLGGDTLKAFVESRAPELIVEPFESDAELAIRMASSEPLDLVVWRQRATETDA